MSSKATSSTGLQLTTQATVAEKSLEIEWSLENEGSSRAYLFAMPVVSFEPNGGAKVNPNMVSVEIEKGAVTVGQKLYPVPDNLLVESPEVPAVVIVEPGATYRRTLRLPLPLRPACPYSRSGHPGSMPGERPLFFELGFFLGTAETMKLGKVLKTNHGDLLYFKPFPEGSQSILRCGPLLPAVATDGTVEG